MRVKDYKILWMFWLYAIAIVVYLVAFVLTHNFGNIALVAVSVFIMALYPGLFFKKDDK